MIIFNIKFYYKILGEHEGSRRMKTELLIQVIFLKILKSKFITLDGWFDKKQRKSFFIGSE